MGTPAPPNEPGVLCNRCFGLDRTFPEPTPKYIDLTISGVMPGQVFNGLAGGLPNGKFRLQQQLPCSWRLVTTDQIFFVLWTISRTVVTVQDSSTLFPFQTPFFTGLCQLQVSNTFQVWNSNSAFGGIAKITWPTEGL